MKNKVDSFDDAFLYKLVRPLIMWFTMFFFTPRFKGKENIPVEDKVILAGNHTHNLDCLLLISATKRNIHFLAKKELWSGFKKVIFSNMGLIPVDRNRKNHDSLEQAYNYLKNGKVIGIFPEGTTEKGGSMLPFKIGAVKMAKETKAKIVPFIIRGKYKLFSKSLEIEFLKPINITSNLTEENEKLQKIIKSKLEA